MAHGAEAIEPPVRPRPPLLRALGRDEPPTTVEIDGTRYQLLRVVKHDSWAATAFYAGADKHVVCKFNRQQRVGIIPMRWLGRWLARREGHALRLLAGLPGIPAAVGDVYAGGRRLPHAVAHNFVAGRPLGRHDAIPIAAFAALEQLLTAVHCHDMAYVDLHKRENILVGDDGRLYLLDFQINFCLKRWWPANAWPMRLFLWILQRSDRYHLGKHIARCCATAAAPTRPWWIRVHRSVARPLRSLRRWLLVLLGVRTGQGRVESEFFPEEVVRADREARKVA
jgi:hypothetical protein